MDEDAVNFMNSCTNSRLKLEQNRGKEGKVDVCKAIQDIFEDGELKGSKKTYVKMCQKFGSSLTDTIHGFAQEFNLSNQEAESFVRGCWKS